LIVDTTPGKSTLGTKRLASARLGLGHKNELLGTVQTQTQLLAYLGCVGSKPPCYLPGKPSHDGSDPALVLGFLFVDLAQSSPAQG
jgi:hypothetical protein